MRHPCQLISRKWYVLATVALSSLWGPACSPILESSATAAQQQILKPSDGAGGDLFSFSVALSGDVALIGSIQSDDPQVGEDVGSAYVYRYLNHQWYPEAKLLASDGAALDTAGGKVALSGDTAVVGASRHDVNGKDAGAAYVFHRADGVWQESFKLTAKDGRPGDAFGQSLAVSSDTLVVGAPHDDVPQGNDAGSVYIFSRGNHGWHQHTQLTAPDGQAGDVFGISVALSGDTVLVGADLHDESENNAGAVYVFARQNDQWQFQAKLMADDPGDTDIFGVRVALDGDTALISARRDDDEVMGVDADSAYVFIRKDGVWKQQAKLTAPDGAEDDRFGRSVALVGNVALISAMHQDLRGENSGSVYVFKRSDNEWRYQSQFTAEDGAAGDVFGWAVALSKQHALIAAPRNDDQGTDSGAAYMISLGQ